MAILKNKTQQNFTMISNNILRDKELKMMDRGLLCTLCSLPDGWEFSVAGLCAIVPDGKSAITSSLKRLEELGYLKRTTYHGKCGKFETEIEVFTEPLPIYRNRKTVTDNPSRSNRHGQTVTENQTQYNTDNIKKNINIKNIKSISLSAKASKMDGETEIDSYKNLVADNIKLEWLLDVAAKHGDDEVHMVREIYDVICDMVCYPREKVEIKGTTYPWTAVKSQFLKLKYQHIADILNRVIDANLGIKNMSAYLVSTLYTQSLIGTLEAQAGLHDDYLKLLRGEPY